MERIIKGFREFKSTFYIENKELYENLGKGQHPHTLFITCSDSRIVPHAITSSGPDELFVIRNVANIVPRYSDDIVSNSGTAPAIEFAVKVLNVTNIVICGHSDCGGCNALYMEKEKLKELPHIKSWIKPAQKIREQVETETLHSNKKGERTEKLNVIEQLKNIRTYPCVKEKLSRKTINLIGCHYDIATGNVEVYNPNNSEFELIN